MGDQVGNHYVLEEEIGRGAFATVYRGRDIRLGRSVAIKVRREDQPRGELSWARMLAEGRAVSALNHVNICRLYDIGEDEDTDYVVLELVEGQDLRTFLQTGPLPVTTVLRYGSEIASALAHAHAAGILHRDLTPSNVMITESGHIKVIDFGLARMIEEEEVDYAKQSHSSIEEAGWLGGTLPYMAPELLHGAAATAQSDIWSLGVLIYEMLTGDLPFSGCTLFEVSTAIMVEKVRPLPRGVPPGLRGIVLRCLAREKALRYKTADAVLMGLEDEQLSLRIRDLFSGHRVSHIHSLGVDLVIRLFVRLTKLFSRRPSPH